MATAKTDAEFKLWLAEHAAGYNSLGTYTNNKTHLMIRHEACGTEWLSRPDMLARGRRCPSCFGTRMGTGTKYQSRLDEKFGSGEYVLIGVYEGNDHPAELRHNKCGASWSPLPRDALAKARRNGCASCYATPNAGHEAFLKKVSLAPEGEEYEVLEYYAGRKTKLAVRHKPCGEIWRVRPANFLRRNYDRCPTCNRSQKYSKGVRRIRTALQSRGIAYEEEKIFQGCRSRRGKLMPFDFFIQPDIVIEYDGSQHDFAFTNRGGQRRLEITRENDSDKTEFCKRYGIKLIRLSHFKQNHLEVDLLEGVQNASNWGRAH